MYDCKLRSVKQTLNGKICVCDNCKQVYIEYKNLQFTFNEKEFEIFKNYFFEVDTQQLKAKNKNSSFKKRIIAPIGSSNLSIMFYIEEIKEIKNLLSTHNATTKLLELNELETELNWN